jgi:hypothetical protein
MPQTRANRSMAHKSLQFNDIGLFVIAASQA